MFRPTYNNRRGSALVLNLRKIESKTFSSLSSISQAYLSWIFPELTEVFKDLRSPVITITNSGYLEFGTYYGPIIFALEVYLNSRNLLFDKIEVTFSIFNTFLIIYS